MGLDPARVVEIYAQRDSEGEIGSGYLVADRVVLTAGHVVRDARSVEVRPLGAPEWIPASVEWAADDGDAAIVSPETAIPVERRIPVRWGRIDGTEPVSCTAVGFPWAQARPDTARDTEQLIGDIAPVTATKDGRYAVSITTSVPRSRVDGGSPWAGMSGAALFAGPYLVGVVVVDPVRFERDRVVAVPAAALAANDEFRRLCGPQQDFVLVDVHPRFRLEFAAGLSFLLRPPYRALPPGVALATAPSHLLHADHGIVPFIGREKQLSDLERWCDDASPVGVRLLYGGGGGGKSRLAAELCRRMVTRGWDAGFVDLAAPGGVTRLELEADCVLAFDDAELKVPVVADLVKQLAYRPPDSPRARVLLIARHRGAWYEQLIRQQPMVEDFEDDPLPLDDLVLGADERAEHFAAAADAFARRLEQQTADVPLWPLSDAAFELPLLVHMNALLTTLGGGREDSGGARAQILARILRREQQRWDETRNTSTFGLGDLSAEVADRAVAVATLVGAATESAAADVLSAIDDLADRERRGRVARWLHELYPGDSYLNGLRPDLLVGEHLARTLPGIPQLAVAVFDRAATSRQRAQLVTVLARAATDQPALVPVVRTLLEARLAELVEASIAAPAGGLATAIAECVTVAPIPALAVELVDRLPPRSVGLAVLAATLQAQAVEHYRALAEQSPDAYLPNLAVSLNNLAIRLADAGRRDDALGPAREAVAHYRALAEQSPDAYLPNLGMSLNNLAVSLADVGRRDDALGPAREAVEHYRALAEQSPDAYLPNLAAALNNLAVRLADVGRRDDALGPAREAVEHYRALAEQSPDAYLPDLATSLRTLAGRLEHVSGPEPAMAAMNQVLEHFAVHEWASGVLVSSRAVWHLERGDITAAVRDAWDAGRRLMEQDDWARAVEPRLMLRSMRANDPDRFDQAWAMSVGGDQPLWLQHYESDEDMAEQLVQWITTQSWHDSRTFLTANARVLLSDRAEATLEHLIDANNGDIELRRHLVILQTARAGGVAAAYAWVDESVDAEE